MTADVNTCELLSLTSRPKAVNFANSVNSLFLRHIGFHLDALSNHAAHVEAIAD